MATFSVLNISQGDVAIDGRVVPDGESITLDAIGYEHARDNLAPLVRLGYIQVSASGVALTADQVEGGDSIDIVLNSIHRASSGTDHSEVVTNVAHRGDTNNPHNIIPIQLLHQVTLVDDTMSPYPVQPTDDALVNNVTIAPILLLLPPVASRMSTTLIVADGSGFCATNPITIQAAPGETINGGPSYVLDVDSGLVTLFAFGAPGAEWVFGDNQNMVDVNTVHRLGDGSDHTNVAANTNNISDGRVVVHVTTGVTYTALIDNAPTQTIMFPDPLPANSIVVGAYMDVQEEFNSAGGGGDPIQALVDVGFPGATNLLMVNSSAWLGSGLGNRVSDPGTGLDGTQSICLGLGGVPQFTIDAGGGATVGDGVATKFTSGLIQIHLFYFSY